MAVAISLRQSMRSEGLAYGATFLMIVSAVIFIIIADHAGIASLMGAERLLTVVCGPVFLLFVAASLRRPVDYTTSDHPAEQRFGNTSDHRAYVFNISTRDLARYGLLYLGCGRWNWRQLVSEAWIRESLTGIDTRIGRPADRQRTGFGDYGYLWQIDRPGARRFEMLETREPYYIASGARGHAMLVMPYLDLVIAHQVATEGGVGMEAQLRRATQGSPEVTEDQLQKLVAAIIAAHPEGRTAFAN